MDVISKYMNDCCIPLSTSYSTYCSDTLATLDSTCVIKSIIIISTEMIHSGARNYATAYSILPPLEKSQLGNMGENLLFWACYQMNGCKHKETLESYCGAECERVYVAFNAMAFICGVLDCQEGLDLLGSRSVICSNVVGMIVTTWFLTLTLDQHTWTFDYADKAMDILRGFANSQTFPQDVKSLVTSKVVGMSPTETGRVLLRQVVIFVTGDLPPLLDLPNLLPGPYQGRVPVENVISAMCYFSEVNDNMKRAIIAQRPVRWICRALAKIVKLGVWTNPLERVLQPFYPIFSYLELLFEDDTSDTLIAEALRHRLLISIARSVAGNGRMIEPKGAYRVEAVLRLIAWAAAREPIVLRLVCRAMSSVSLVYADSPTRDVGLGRVLKAWEYLKETAERGRQCWTVDPVDYNNTGLRCMNPKVRFQSLLTARSDLSLVSPSVRQTFLEVFAMFASCGLFSGMSKIRMEIYGPPLAL